MSHCWRRYARWSLCFQRDSWFPRPGFTTTLTMSNRLDITPTEVRVRFADDPAVPFPFRGKALQTTVAGRLEALIPKIGERTLASSETGPIWVMAANELTRQYRSSLPAPGLPKDGILRDVINGDRFLEILPLLEFVREVCGTRSYEGPPLRACFMFDDPNLHWPRYGFIDYAEIAARAASGNYHVAFATVPLDGWFIHRPTAEIFRNNAEQLSLLIHGNDHTRNELARPTTQSARVQVLGQAIRRSQRIEARAGIPVSRVMAAPHGACSEAMLEDFPKCGFESAAISHGSLRAHNRGMAWTKGLGYLPSEIIKGCPVLPRWGITGTSYNTVLMSAYLRQPLIFRGHHGDLKEGVEILDTLAHWINGLGSVRWANMTTLSRMNYMWRIDGKTMRIRPMGTKLAISVKQGVDQIVVEEPQQYAWGGWCVAGVGDELLSTRSGEPIPAHKRQDETITMKALTDPLVSDEPIGTRLPAWAFLRRLLTEGRDRLAPI